MAKLPINVLVTAFEPFGGATVNTSQWVVEELARLVTPEEGLSTLVLPVLFDDAADLVVEFLLDNDVQEILLMGMAAKSEDVLVEVRAQNRDHSDVPDNAGIKRDDWRIDAEGPDELSPFFPRESFKKFLWSRGITTQLSDSAGSYVCNNTFYLVAHALAEGGEPFEAPACTFVHIPGPRSGENPGGWNREQAAFFARALVEWFRVPRGA